MPGWSAGDLAYDHDRARPDAASVLVLSMSPLPDQGQVHDGRLPARYTLGARSGAGGDAGAPREDARGGTHPPADCRACLWHPQELDGHHALPDEEATERENGDEPAPAGLQPQTRDANPRGRTPDERHEEWKPSPQRYDRKVLRTIRTTPASRDLGQEDTYIYPCLFRRRTCFTVQRDYLRRRLGS